jgi:hypothetical protein
MAGIIIGGALRGSEQIGHGYCIGRSRAGRQRLGLFDRVRQFFLAVRHFAHCSVTLCGAIERCRYGDPPQGFTRAETQVSAPFFSSLAWVGWNKGSGSATARECCVAQKRRAFLVRNRVEGDPSPAAGRWHFGPERAGHCTFCMNAATAILPLSPVALTMVQQTSERFI